MSLGKKQELVIDLLRSGEMYGLDLVRQSDGLLKRRSVYFTLTAMEAEGLIEGEEVPPSKPGLLPRRLYRVTEDGLQLFLNRHVSLPEARVVSI